MALAYDGAIQRLIDAFGRLPGIGPKGAQRIAFYMLSAPEDEARDLAEAIEEVKAKIAASKVNSLFDNAEEVSGVKIASAYFTGTTGETLRGMCDSIRDKAVNPVVAVLVGKAEDKVTIAVTVNKLAQ